MKAKANELFKLLPGKITAKWPTGERFIPAIANGSMTVELYAPIGNDPQQPHKQDELYFIISGNATLTIAGERFSCETGDCFFVAAGNEHRFEEFSNDFSTWVVFWGPEGGERK
jgi:mannose-6-phosphate isomerase-like protein (cupin superfamily)